MKRFLLKALLAVGIFSFTGFGTYNFGSNDIRVVQALTVYYTPNGKSIHFSRNCRTLANSKKVYSGEFEDVKKFLSDICDVCGHGSISSNNSTSSSSNQNTTTKQLKVVKFDSEKCNEYLKHSYKEAFNREIDNDGLTYWHNQISLGKSSVEDFTISILTSDEFKGLNLNTEDSIKRAYKVMFGRDADSDGLTYWTKIYNSYSKANALSMTAKKMMQSDEFKDISNSIVILG